MKRKRKSARYQGTIRYVPLTIRNCHRDEMREKLNRLPFLGYHVETLADKRKVCITKPGGKAPFGRMKVNDFMVWIYDEAQQDRWRISHDEIYDDVATKLRAAPRLGSALVDRMREVCEGAEPSEVARRRSFQRFALLPGFPADLILKVYKWIWVQEDCNYPTGEGRWMSMEPILRLRDRMIRQRGKSLA